MARGKTLLECLTALRTELRLSLNEASNVAVRDTHIAVLQRAQEQLAEEYTWPHLRVERFIRPQDGQRYYDPAGCKKINQTTGVLEAAGDMVVDNIAFMWLRDGSVWRPLSPEIPNIAFDQFDSDTGETSWPIERWRIAEGDNIEFWPVPAQDGDEDTFDNMVKMVGRRNLASFTQDSHQADIDDQILVLFAAAKLARDPKEAEKKLGEFRKRMFEIKANANPRRSFTPFGSQRPRRLLRGPPTVYVRTS